MGNTDAHSKNWGLIYPDGRNARLAPAYDLVCVAAYFDSTEPNALALNRKLDESLRAWGEDRAEALARAAGFLQFNRARRVVRETQKVAAATWPALLEGAPASVRNTVLARLKELVPAPRPAAHASSGRRAPST
jgi:serine/threonine-protein kinase HipA